MNTPGVRQRIVARRDRDTAFIICTVDILRYLHLSISSKAGRFGGPGTTMFITSSYSVDILHYLHLISSRGRAIRATGLRAWCVMKDTEL